MGPLGMQVCPHLLAEAQKAEPLVGADDLVLGLQAQETTEGRSVASLRQSQTQHLHRRLHIDNFLLLLLRGVGIRVMGCQG